MDVKKVQDEYKKYGYYMDEELAKKVMLFENSAKNSKMSVPTMLLTGQAGGGKTSLAEIFGKKLDAEFLFMQCVPGMGIENMQLEPNIEAILKKDPENAIKKGLLVRAIESSKTKPTVVLLDEIDKARADVDSFLLDFIQNGRISTGSEEYVKGEYPIYLMMTSNGERDLSDALENRSKKVEVPRLSREKFLECLNLPQDHYLGDVYSICKDFSLRQAYMYLEDLKVLGVEFDADALGQYVDEIEINSLSEFERASSIGKYANVRGIDGINFDINMYPQLLDVVKEYGLHINSEKNEYDEIRNTVGIDSAEQLVKVEKFIEERYGYIDYTGFVEVEKSDVEGAVWSEGKIGDIMIGFLVRDGEPPLEIVKKDGENSKYLVKVKSNERTVHTLKTIKEKEEKLQEEKDEDIDNKEL